MGERDLVLQMLWVIDPNGICNEPATAWFGENVYIILVKSHTHTHNGLFGVATRRRLLIYKWMTGSYLIKDFRYGYELESLA